MLIHTIRNHRGPLLVALLGAVPAVPGAFVLAGILQGADAQGMLHDLVQPRYFAWPSPIVLHITAGIVFCLLAPVQFLTRFRIRAPRWHRRIGRVAMGAGLLFGLSALPLLDPVRENASWLRYFGLAVAALAFSGALSISLVAIRKRDIAAHKAWALRAIAIGLMGASRVIIETFAYLVLGELSETTGGAVIWLAVVLNLILVEQHLRKTAPGK